MGRQALALNSPWVTLWNEIRYSVGEDPDVLVLPLDTRASPYVISVQVATAVKAQAMASILAPNHTFGNVSVNVRVLDSGGNVVQAIAMTSSQAVNLAFSTALGTNRYFLGAFPVGSLSTSVGVLLTREIVQFYNDDPFGTLREL
jgi:hypothetical protein